MWYAHETRRKLSRLESNDNWWCEMDCLQQSGAKTVKVLMWWFTVFGFKSRTSSEEGYALSVVELKGYGIFWAPKEGMK